MSNHKERLAKLNKLVIKKTSAEHIQELVKEAMEASEDDNNAGESYADRLIMKMIEAVEVPGLQED
jgi:hypothetical protein